MVPNRRGGRPSRGRGPVPVHHRTVVIRRRSLPKRPARSSRPGSARHPQAVVGEEPFVSVAERGQARPGDLPPLALCRGAAPVHLEEEGERLERAKGWRQPQGVRLGDGPIERVLGVAKPVRAGELERAVELAQRHRVRLADLGPDAAELPRRIGDGEGRRDGRLVVPAGVHV